MSGIADRVYNASPVFLQNLAVSLMGVKLRRQRYGGKHPRFLRELKASERLSAAELRRVQDAELRRVVALARESVPYYRNLPEYRALRADALTVDTLPQLLPTVAKQTVRTRAAEFYSDRYQAGETLVIHTSGTTGTPLDIRVSHAALQRNYAFFARMLGWYGVAPNRDRSATFAGRLIIPQRQEGPPYWRYNRGMNNLLLSSYRLSDATMAQYWAELQRWQPVFFDSYPSAIHSLASFVERNGLPRTVRPRVVVTSSETVTPQQRATIEAVFGCPLRDHLGCAEMALWVTQCEQGRYHANPEYGIVEVLRPDGTPCAPGEMGDLCCTGFVNDAMPLIRYKLGDSAVPGSGQCDCGRAYPIIETLVGRTDDILRTPDGRLIGRLDPVFKGAAGIVETQIVQTEPANIDVLVVPTDEFDAVAEGSLRTALLKRLTPDMTVQIRRVAAIPRTANGKFRSVVSLLPR